MRVDHRRIGRRRLPCDSACPGRAIDPHQIRTDHGAFPGRRSTFLDHSRGIWVASSMPPTPAPVAESRSVQGWRDRELRRMSLHRRMLMGNPNA
jgi:hypothetical protein